MLIAHARELEFTNQHLEQFAYIASHDLQEPLWMITSFLKQLEKKYGGKLDEKGHQYIYFATDGANRVRQIILDLLEYSRVGKNLEAPENVDKDIIEDYLILRKKIIEEKNVIIIFENLPTVRLSKPPFTQAIHSLLDNSIKYGKESIPPKILISASETVNSWQIQIKDNRIGIEPEYFEKIFVLFQRLHNRNEYEGTGIGLAIAKKNVESWNGKIWLESKVDEGSTFYFTIPKT
ncbi:sensor histidine kinase [Arthrospiribacter ruber]|uniref:histidine kinase n=1 Tax=Arthrospiribacter ruber TaxID=2487934 RepID=A0A951MF97_9BACT|nr:ATP-binding protein [Arthrospiribacter ruber]MBW3468411.1 hypothetical protein [Arthrospiribacter ruber]